MKGKKVTTKIKDGLSKSSGNPSPEPDPSKGSMNVDNPFTLFVLSNLEEQDHKMVAMAFAPQIQTDCDARNLDFDDFFHLLGHKTKSDAIRTLHRIFTEDELVDNSRDIYLISINQFEEVLLAANTDVSKKWRKLLLKIKTFVVQYMRMEMEASARAANERFAIEEARRVESDARRSELEAVQADLQATLKAEKERRSTMNALRDAEDEPRQTAYLMESG